ncbi:Scr1 family TA system antitoxin-like transcriptional regulator [Streptomyces sp. NPDC006465]|uniref:helix-turn-helix domain-containing protein n=1 Tax=Streptomyces sp. NPDC006465 TaxID=3157174 RepID=UPI0033A6DD6B
MDGHHSESTEWESNTTVRQGPPWGPADRTGGGRHRTDRYNASCRDCLVGRDEAASRHVEATVVSTTERAAVAVQENPMILRQRLRDRLKRARETAGLTQRQVADTFGWSPSKVIRIENGRIGVSVTDAMALVAEYGIESEEARQLIDLTKAARQPSWFTAYRSVITPEFETFLAYEESASIVRAYERDVVPGLLQTEEYARALLQGIAEGGEEGGDEVLELRVDLRMKRQKILQSDEAEFFFILDESALHRRVGNAAIMRQQHEALLRINETSNVNVFYVPFTAGAYYPLFRGPCHIFESSSADDDLVTFLENPDGDVILSEKTPRTSKRKDPADYLDAFWKVERNYAVEISRDILPPGGQDSG